MAIQNYVVTINVTVPVEEEPFDGTQETLEALAGQVGQAVFSAIVRGDAAGRVLQWAKLPGSRSIADRPQLQLEDTHHPAMVRKGLSTDVPL